jgi:acetylornithine deacetylase/succinyl-diaminopimelate desuccinylase-like protein
VTRAVGTPLGTGAATATPRPSDGLHPAVLEAARTRLIDTLRDLIRIPSVNPPAPDRPDGETRVARYLADALEASGVPATVVESAPGRGSVTARLRGDGTGGAPLLLLSHVDVVPAPLDRWTHDPFGADLEDGWVYGRGAVDMKNLVAMELEVVRMLAERARAAGLDPARDPIPGLRRDILFASTADEEMGGVSGAGYLRETAPETLRAAGAINESGGVSIAFAGRRLYPIQVAEKGIIQYTIRIEGTWGHGSMPREDNAAVAAAEAVRRLAEPTPVRLTGPMQTYLERAIAAFETPVAGDAAVTPEAAAAARGLRALAAGDPRATELMSAVIPAGYVRALRALVRDTISPNVIQVGVKTNVIPGEATVQVDIRTLPGTTADDVREIVEARLGRELMDRTTIGVDLECDPIETQPAGELWEVLASSIVAADPDGIPLPVMAPYSTDAKHLIDLGVPVFGFSPLRQPDGELYMDRFHGVDERVSVEGMRWGLAVLYDAVVRFCS